MTSNKLQHLYKERLKSLRSSVLQELSASPKFPKHVKVKAPVLWQAFKEILSVLSQVKARQKLPSAQKRWNLKHMRQWCCLQRLYPLKQKSFMKQKVWLIP